MIWESSYWKSDLIKDAGILERWAKKKPTERQYILFEKKIFISAYAIRKLIESEKIGTDFPMWCFNLEIFQKKAAKEIDYLNRHNIDEHYDLKKAFNDNKSISDLCNLIIHSYIFSLGFNDVGEINSFLFSSDKTKEKLLYSISIEKYIDILKWIGYSHIIQEHGKRDPKQMSGFKIRRQYCFDDCIPRKGLPKTQLTYLSDYNERCLESEK